MQEYNVIVYVDRTEWFQNGKWHRENGPAIEWADGKKEWYQNGRLHRTDGPAFEMADGIKSWWINGQRHRTDGPAIEWEDGKKEWWVNGNRYSELEYHNKLSPVKELTVAEVEKLLGHRVKIVK